MATLIQSKQIEGVVTASVVQGDFSITGVLRATGSGIFTNDVTASGVISASRILGVNYDDISGTPNFTAGSGILITQVGDNITITNTGGSGGDGTSDAAAIAQLNAYTASNDIVISGLNQTTASLQSQINALVSATSSYLTTDNTGSDSQTLTIVGDQLTISGGNTITIPTGSGGGTSDFTQLTNVPSGLVSSSEQILGGSNIVSGSVLRTLDGTTVLSASVTFEQFSASLASEFQNIQHTQIPQGTISSSQQILDLGFVTSSGELTLPSGLISSSQQLIDLGFSTTDNTGSDSQTLSISGNQISISGGNTIIIPTGSDGTTTDITLLNQFTQSAESRLSALESATGSYLTSETDSQTLSIVGDQLTISDGNTITIPTGSGGTATDISSLNQFTQSIQSQVDSLTAATSSYLTELPSGLVSGSVLRTLDGTGVVSGSVLRTLDGTGVLSGSIVTDLSTSLDSRISVLESQTDNTGSDTQTLSIVGNQITISDGNTITIPTGSDLPSGIISSSQQISDLGYVTSSLEAPFNGDRVVSNTLLGELYSQSFNAGTTGSLAEFITAVFFPSEAPTATFTNQTANWNENLATDGTNLVSVSLTDTVDNSPYTLVLSGTDASSLLAVPTNSDSSSWEIRANGDLNGNTYSYNVTVGDSTNAERTYTNRNIVVDDANTGFLSTNGNLYIIESATSGVITLSTSGRPGSTGGVSVSYSPNYGSQVATNFQSSNPLIAINSTNGQLSVGNPISGSGNLSGDTITSNITYNDQYGNVGSGSISVTVTQNNAPDIVFTNSSILNTNQATGSSGTLVTISFTDTEGDSINHNSFTFTETSGQLQSTKSGNNYLVTATSDLSASNYTITCSVEDIHGFRTNTETHTFTIAQASSGTLTGDTSIYIVESAVSGDSFRDATGFGNGNLAQIGVSYSPNLGSQVPTISSSNPAISVDGSGNLTLGVDLSGSVTQSGDSFTSLISWSDQYGNQGSGSITATVFGNQSPSVNFTDNGLSDVTAVSGSNIGSLSITDTESNSPFVVTIGGTDGSKFGLVPQNEQSSSWIVQPNQSLSIGTYSVQFTVVDSYSEQAVLNETILVGSDSDFGKVYVYTLSGLRTNGLDNYDGYMGILSENTVTEPDLVTQYNDFGPSPLYALKTGNLGNSSITVGSGTMTLRAERSGSNLDSVISSSFTTGNTAEQILIIFPSGSDMNGNPTSMTDSAGNTNGEYILYLKGQSDSSYGAVATQIHMFDVDSPVDGYTRWNVIGRTTTDADSSFEARLIPSSGSAPS